MDECSPTNTFPNLHLHHPQSFHIVLPNHHSSEPGYSPAPPPLSLQPCQEDQPMSCFSALDTSSQQTEGNNGGERGLESTLDCDVNTGGHLEEEERTSWYDTIQKDNWDGGIESPTDGYYDKGNCYRNINEFVYSNESRLSHRRKAIYSSCSQVNEIGYKAKANPCYVTKQATFSRDAGNSGSNHNSLEYCRTDSVISDGHLERGDFVCSGSSSEDHLQQAEVDTNPWLSVPSLNQNCENRWREGESNALTSIAISPKPLSLSSRSYTQKLDSFSDAFLSQAKRRFPVITTGDAHGQIWDNGIRSRLSCSFDSDSSSPSLPSFPSPPTSNLLSPPPTPLPPASYSPSSKMDSPQNGPSTSVYTVPQGGGEALQFFPIRPQSIHDTNPSGMIWKFPLLSHCFPQLSGDSSSTEGNPRSAIGSNHSNSTVLHEVVQSLAPSSSQLPVLHSSKALCFSNSPPLNTFFHSASHSAHIFNHQNEATFAKKSQKGPTSLETAQRKVPGCPVYTGTTFPSMLQSKTKQKRAHFTPQPLLNPLRKGTGLYSSICHKEYAAVCKEVEKNCGILPCINVGPDFQADIPPCTFGDGSEECSHDEEESPREQLLWKPLDELTHSTVLEDQVDKLLQMSSSSCLPGGGTNTELALHCLRHCQGDIVATLEMLLFSQPMPAGDYHYSGSDVWTESEKSLFAAALDTYSKDFSLIQIMVKTKTVAQCVEFYYLSKRLEDKRKTQKMQEETKAEELEQSKRATPTGQPIARQMRLEEAVPVPSLASFFPCKLCGKMFYKIKSRNAHMKIHRQPQEDWTDRKLQQQILNQALSRTPNIIAPTQAQTLTFAGTNNPTSNNSINLNATIAFDHSPLVAFGSSSSSHGISNMEAGESSQSEPTSVLQFQSIWGPFGQTSDGSSFYCSQDVKTEAEEGTETAKWK